MAEVLITLGIIGVVAAMTLPALVNSTQKRELKTSLKKNYSIAQQALSQMNYDNGITIAGSAYEGRTFEQMYVKYFKVLRDCGLEACVPHSTEENDDGSSISWHIANYKTYTKKRNVQTSMFDDGQFYLIDGSLYLIENPYLSESNSTLKVYITIDVNGATKNPNAWGHDLFTFQVMDNGQLKPMGAPDTNYLAEEYCNPNSTSGINGIGCTYYALTDEDYFNNLP